MTDKDMGTPENPPAFPSQLHEAREPGDYDPQFGMSLRDWFATHAAMTPWQFQHCERLPESDDFSPEGIRAQQQAEAEWELAREVAWRWKFADAMLAEREKSS